MNAKSGSEHDVKNRIKAAWQKWKDLAGVLCDAKMSNHQKRKVGLYKTMIRPVLTYGAKAWTVTRRGERAEMRMLRWILGASLKDKKSNEVIRKTLGVACITNKIRDAKRGRKLDKRQYCSQGQRTPQSRTTEEATGRHHAARHEVYPIKEGAYC